MRTFITPIVVVLLFFGCEKSNISEDQIPQPNQLSLQDIEIAELPFSVENLHFKNSEDHTGDGFKSLSQENVDDDFKLIHGVDEDKFVRHTWKNGFTSYSAPLFVELSPEQILFGSFIRFSEHEQAVEQYHLYIAENTWFKNNYTDLDLVDYTGIKKIFDALGKLQQTTYYLGGKVAKKRI